MFTVTGRSIANLCLHTYLCGSLLRLLVVLSPMQHFSIVDSNNWEVVDHLTSRIRLQQCVTIFFGIING